MTNATNGIAPVWVTKVGTIRYVSMLYDSLTSNVSAGTWYTLGNVPEDYRYSTDKHIGGCFIGVNGTVYGFRGQYKSNGEIRVVFEKNISTSEYLFGTVVVVP